MPGNTKQRVGLIGLGNLGRPMAENLLAGGFAVTVYNRSPDKAKPLADKGATVAGAPHEAAPPGGIVITVLADDRAVEAVADDRFAQALGPGGIHLSMSTILPETADRLARQHAEHGAAYVGAPVFGRPEAAAARKLWICASGPADAKARAKPVFDALGQGVYDFGDAPGAAHVVKIAGNFVINAAVETMAEASAFAEKSGLPRAALLGFLTQTLFNAPVYQNYARKLIEANYRDVGFAMALGLKDTDLALRTASGTRTPLPIASLLRDRFLAALANGREDLDAAAFALGAADDAGLEWFK